MFHFQSYQIIKLQNILSYRNFKCALQMHITEVFLPFIKHIMSALYIAGAALRSIKYLYKFSPRMRP